MSIFIGGCVALLLGIIGIIAWWSHFVAILQGIIPIMLICAGGLAVYLSYDQIKAWHASRNSENKKEHAKKGDDAHADDIEALRKENEKLKKQVEEYGYKAKDAVEKAGDAVGDIIENTTQAETEGLLDASVNKPE